MMPACTRIDTFDQFCDQVTVSEVTHAENWQRQQQQSQPQQQQQQKQPTDSSSKGGNGAYPPSISAPVDTTGSGKFSQPVTNKHGQSGRGWQSTGLPPAPWVSKEMFEGWSSTGKYSPCGSLNHKVSFCPIYLWGSKSPQQQDQILTPNWEGGHQFKWQKYFDNQQPKNS